MAFALDELEPRALVDATRRDEDVVRPEREFPIPRRASEPDASLRAFRDDVFKALATPGMALFDDYYARMVVSANRYHDIFNKGFIQWKRPDMPPPNLDLTPRD